jgi:MFS family permease
MSGLIGGSLISALMDKFGRKKILVLAVLLGATGSLGNAFVNTYALFCLMRFITATGS